MPADWKLIVEQWLEFSLTARPRDALAALAVRGHVELNALTGTTEWQATLPADASGWTAARYAHLAARFETALLQRLYLPPHQLLESRPDGLTVLQVLPQAPGRCRVRRFEFRRASADPAARALTYLGTRLSAASEARRRSTSQPRRRRVSLRAVILAWITHLCPQRWPAFGMPSGLCCLHLRGMSHE